VRPTAKTALHEIWIAETKREAQVAFDQFLEIHICSSNVIESSFATVRHRVDHSKGCLTRDGMLVLIDKRGLAESPPDQFA
jgi:hypothetical protein